jgi:hypothetical protein
VDIGRRGIGRRRFDAEGGGFRKITTEKRGVEKFVGLKVVYAVLAVRIINKPGKIWIITVEEKGDDLEEEGGGVDIKLNSPYLTAAVVKLVPFYFIVQGNGSGPVKILLKIAVVSPRHDLFGVTEWQAKSLKSGFYGLGKFDRLHRLAHIMNAENGRT